MRQCDFLLTYEIRNREAENICLVKYELERRGYSVIIDEQYRTFFDVPEPIDAKVVAIPAYYRNRARFYTASHVKMASRILNFQWEQISTNSRSQKGGLASIKPWGYGAMHISWGNDDAERLVNVYGVPKEHVTLTGHIGMDFLQPSLRKYYVSKDDLCKKYGIPVDSEICLFISSFVVTDITDRVFEKASANSTERETLDRYRQESLESYRIIIQWFDRFLTDNPQKVIIYRPHPEEKNSEILRQMSERHDNFFVISDYSVKQWILVSDQIFTWVSTSIAEIFFSGKDCLVLQPVRFSELTTMRIYEHATVISTYEEFENAVQERVHSFPIPEEDMHYYYWRSNEKMSYELVCDTLEKVLKEDEYILPEPLKNPFSGIINLERMKCFIKRTIANSTLLKKIHDKDLFKGSTFRKNLDDVFYVKEKLEKNHVTEEEFAEIYDRIDMALNDKINSTVL